MSVESRSHCPRYLSNVHSIPPNSTQKYTATKNILKQQDTLLVSLDVPHVPCSLMPTSQQGDGVYE